MEYLNRNIVKIYDWDSFKLIPTVDSFMTRDQDKKYKYEFFPNH